MVEPPAVNRLVAGSNPARGAIFLLPVYKLLFYREIFKAEIVGKDDKSLDKQSYINTVAITDPTNMSPKISGAQPQQASCPALSLIGGHRVK